MIDEANEQALWFTRRIVELERKLEEERERATRAEYRARDEVTLANDLADLVRRFARGETGIVVTSDEPNSWIRVEMPLERWRHRRRESYPAYRTVPVDPFEEEPWP